MGRVLTHYAPKSLRFQRIPGVRDDNKDAELNLQRVKILVCRDTRRKIPVVPFRGHRYRSFPAIMHRSTKRHARARAHARKSSGRGSRAAGLEIPLPVGNQISRKDILREYNVNTSASR